jgi:hypothetical protein
MGVNWSRDIDQTLAAAKVQSRPILLWEVADDLEQAISDIQLSRTPEQARLAQRFGEDLGTNQAAELDSLLTELRKGYGGNWEGIRCGPHAVAKSLAQSVGRLGCPLLGQTRDRGLHWGGQR